MKAIAEFRRRMEELGEKFNCDKCPIPKKDCDSLAIFLFDAPRCLLRQMMLEIFIFRASMLEKERRKEKG